MAETTLPAEPSPAQRMARAWRLPSIPKPLRRAAILAFYAVLAVTCVMAVQRTLGPAGLGAIIPALASMTHVELSLSAAMVVCVYAIMWAMEQFALADVGEWRRARRLYYAPLISNALSIGAGFGVFSGGALRVRLYGRVGAPATAALFVASSVTIMSVLGGVFVAALGLVLQSERLAPAAAVGAGTLRLIGAAILAGLATLAVLAGTKGRTLTIARTAFRLPSARGFLFRLALGACDWMFSAAALYVLLPRALRSDFLSFASTFAASHLIAMSTGAPAGLGVFETIMLAAAPGHVSPDSMAAALICYRLISFAAPIGLALIALAAVEARAEPTQRDQARARRHANSALNRAVHWLLRARGDERSQLLQNQTKGALFARALRMPPISPRQLTRGGPLLVIAPHPDDETLGCGGLIAACARARIPVHVAILTDGERSHPGSRHWPPQRLGAARRREATMALQRLGVRATALTFLGLQDGRLLASAVAREAAIRQLTTLARRLRAKRIIGPWRHDPHPDHVAAAEITRAIADALPHARALYYPIWGRFLPGDVALTDRRWRPLRIDVSPFLPAKRRALAAHRTQTSRIISDAWIDFSAPRAMQRDMLAPFELYFADWPRG